MQSKHSDMYANNIYIFTIKSHILQRGFLSIKSEIFKPSFSKSLFIQDITMGSSIGVITNAIKITTGLKRNLNDFTHSNSCFSNYITSFIRLFKNIYSSNEDNKNFIFF